MKYKIARPIEGISLNGLEFLLDAPDGEPLEFESPFRAKEFLYELAEKDDVDDDIEEGAILMVVEGGGNVELNTALAEAICTEHNKMFSDKGSEVANLSMRYV